MDELMRAQVVPAAGGARWLAAGWRCFRAAPLGWMLLVFAYMMATQVVALVPLIGSPLAAMLIPGFTLGFMAVARGLSNAQSPRFDMRLLFEGFRADARRQLLLGAVYLVCGLAVIGATLLADSDGVLRGMLAGERRPDEASAAGLLAPLAAFALVYAPVMMMFWYAPALCAWHSAGVLKALFFSFFACLINWRAFLAYGAVMAAVLLVLNVLLAAVVVFGAAELSKQQLFSLAFPLLLLVAPVFFASFYASYRDVFVPPAAGADPAV